MNRFVKPRSVWTVTVLKLGLVTVALAQGQPPMTVLDDKTQKMPQHLRKSTVDFSRFERTGILNGNLIRTAYSNFCNLGSRKFDIRLEWPKGSGINYGFEFIYFAGGEVISQRGDTIHIITDKYTGGPRDRSPDDTHMYGWEPLPGYFNDGDSVKGLIKDGVRLINDVGAGNLGSPAQSNLMQTWPEDWPLDFYLENGLPPGSRKGLWNGEFGAYVRADQESYYVADDRNNDEFYYFPFDPRIPGSQATPTDTLPWPRGRRGLGMEVEVRNYQWADPLAEDIIISIYQVKNRSDKDLNKNVVGMYVDADIGTEGPASDAGDDASFFEKKDDITYQWDLDGLSAKGKKVGYFGFAFLQSPGNSVNGIDDDEDGLIDEDQENGIDDDGDWRPFDDRNGNGVWDWEDDNLNGILDPGEDKNGNGILDIEDLFDDTGSDGLTPLDNDYPGPDPDGTQGNGKPDPFEPNFEFTDNDEIDQIGLTSFFGTSAGDVVSDDEGAWNEKLRPGFFTEATTGLDVAYIYGCGYFKLPKKKSERFAIASLMGNDFDDLLRNKRTMQTIYDHDYNFKKPPLEPTLTAIPGDRRVTLIWDDRAERSRDPIYGEDFEMYKVYRSTDPSFNDIKTITDAFGNPVLWKPLRDALGRKVQFDLKDGLKGAHPIPIGDTGVHYDMGDDTGLKHSYIDTTVENGRTYYYAVVSVDQGYDLDFFERGISKRDKLTPSWPSECGKVIETDLQGNVVSHGRNTAVVLPTAPAAGYRYPAVVGSVKHTQGIGTGGLFVDIIFPDSVKDGHQYQVTFKDTTLERKTNGFFVIDVTNPSSPDTVHRGTGHLFEDPRLERTIIDGFKISSTNDTVATVAASRWLPTGAPTPTGVTTVEKDASPTAVALPEDFEIRVCYDKLPIDPVTGKRAGCDTSYSPIARFRKPVNFQIWSLTTGKKMEFLFNEAVPADSLLTLGDQIIIITGRRGSSFRTTWSIQLRKPTNPEDPIVNPGAGSVFRFTTRKPFNRDDLFEFTVSGWKFDAVRARSDLDRVYVVPDPYVAVNTVEKPAFNIRGRGERRVDFVNLPKKCTIRIFTISGKLVKQIEHESDKDDGSEPWNLVTKDGLDAAFGTYIFHVEAPGLGEKIGKFALIR